MLEVWKTALTQAMSSIWAKVHHVQWSQLFCKKVQGEKQTNPFGQELEREELLQVKVEKKNAC